MTGAVTPGPSPADAVTAWWQAMQRQDRAALGSLAREDLVSACGANAREIGRDSVLEGAARFFAEATIER